MRCGIRSMCVVTCRVVHLLLRSPLVLERGHVQKGAFVGGLRTTKCGCLRLRLLGCGGRYEGGLVAGLSLEGAAEIDELSECTERHSWA